MSIDDRYCIDCDRYLDMWQPHDEELCIYCKDLYEMLDNRTTTESRK
jgi:hypothetical protein